MNTVNSKVGIPTQKIWGALCRASLRLAGRGTDSSLSQAGARLLQLISFNQKDLMIAIRVIFLVAVYIKLKIAG